MRRGGGGLIPPRSVTIRGPRDLVASIPAVLGFVPGPGSLVMMCGEDADGRTGPVVRVDHPDLDPRGSSPEPAGGGDSHVARDGALPQFLADLCDREGVDRVWLVAVVPGCTDPCDDMALRTRDALEELDWWLSTAGVEVIDAFGVDAFEASLPWTGFLGSDDGIQADPGATELAAVHAVLGHPTFGSREEIEHLYRRRDPDAVDDDPALRWRGGAAEVDRALRILRAAADTNGPQIDDTTLAEVGSALRDRRVRDGVLVDLAERPLTEGDGRRRLWWEIARRRPAAERSVALCLLGCAAYHEGGGAQARAALEEALRADPGNTLAGLVLEALDNGIHPSEVRRVLLGG